MGVSSNFGYIVAIFVVVAAVFLALDPLKQSPIAGLKNFSAKEVPTPSWEILGKIPRDNQNKLKAADIKFGGQVFGPESVLFDSQGRGPYSGVGDGRVMRWDGEEKGWVEFAVIISNRTEKCNQPIPLRANIEHEHLCGRPLGIRFNKGSGDMFIADAYFGLLKVGPNGGVAELLTDQAEGQKFLFTNDLDIDHDGTVYFTDSSAKYPRKKFFYPFLEGEDTGRLLKWDPNTKETSVLLRNLRFPNGVAFSKDHTFLVVCETVTGRLIKYWVKGPKAGTAEDFAWLPGYPDNVRANSKGEFWVALYARRNSFEMFIKSNPLIRSGLLKLPISVRRLHYLLARDPIGEALRFSEKGELLEILEDQNGDVVTFISEIEEHDGKLYLGSVILPHIAVYTLEG